MQSQYTALLIPTQHQLAQGLQGINPGREASCPELTRKERKDAGCWREGIPSPSLPLGIPTGRQPLCVLQLRAASLSWLAGDAFHHLQLARGQLCILLGNDLCHVFISTKRKRCDFPGHEFIGNVV